MDSIFNSLEEAFEFSNFLDLEDTGTSIVLENSENAEDDSSFDAFSEFFL